MKKYNTEQRKYLLDFFTEHTGQQFTIDVLEKSVKGISVSTIYRNINKMVEEGILNRFQKEGSRKFLYQYIGDSECAQHLHLKCNKCGSILHMDNIYANKIVDIINISTRFHMDKNKTIIFGHCDACK